jgi:hypothetical protein
VNSWSHNPEDEGDISPAREVAIPYKYLKIFGLGTENVMLRRLFLKVTVKGKGKASRYRPGVAQRVSGR